MQSGYTCQRCLQSIGRLTTLRPSSPAYRSVPRRRWYTTTSTPNLKDPAKQDLANAQRRGIASIESRGQTSDEGILDIRNPPRLADPSPSSISGNVLLEPNNLFHHWSVSPSPDIRRRAAFMKTHALCPHPAHHPTRTPLSPHDPEARKEQGTQAPAYVRFECPDCGIPVSCTEEHWADDYESHMEICDTLRQVNEDDHDWRSGRFFPEFEYPPPNMEEAMVNMMNWDTYLYTREFKAINEERPLRQVTKLLTYPVTIGSILSELSPYDYKKGDRLTTEGLKSFSGTFLSPLTIPPH